MIQSSSLATLIVVSRLSCPSRARFAAKPCPGGISSATVDEILCVASFALAVTFSATAHAPGPLNLAEKEKAEADRRDVHGDIEECLVVDNNNVKVMWMQRSRFSALKLSPNYFVRPWPDLWPTVACGQPLWLVAGIDANEQRPRISTRRQRRAYDTSSCHYSDFCNTDLSRQIVAMVSEIEAAYQNRHVRKSKHVINQQTCADTEPSVTKGVEQVRCMDLSSKRIKKGNGTLVLPPRRLPTTPTSGECPPPAAITPEERAAASDDLASSFEDAFRILNGAIAEATASPIATPQDVAPGDPPTIASDDDDDVLIEDVMPSSLEEGARFFADVMSPDPVEPGADQLASRWAAPKIPGGADVKNPSLFESTPMKNLSPKTSKLVKDTPQLQWLRRAPPTMQESDDCVPAMTPCDSVASLSSNFSVCTGSSSVFSGASPAKKPWTLSPHRNAEWAILE